MTLHPNKYINFLLQLLYAALICVALYLGFKYALKWVFPLIIAYVLSAIILKPVDYLCKKLRFPRKLTAAVFTLLTVTLAVGLCYLIISTLVYEAVQLVNSLPSIAESVLEQLDGAQVFFDDIFKHLPAYLRDAPMFSLESWLGSLSLPQISVSGVFSSVTSAASFVPSMIISLVFIFVATYFLTGERSAISTFLRRQMSTKLYDSITDLRSYLSSSLFRWIKAQGILICVTFAILCVGFFIFRQPYAVLIAVIIALVDALPILGAGTILIPWALINLIGGDFKHAAAMGALYALVLIVRNTLEPHVVGTQLGMHPFVSLMCVYFGFRLAGFAGMFLVPLVVICLIHLHETGRIKLWK